ncbi:flagellar hook-basal body complex protein [Alkalibacillus salilacus]|uniref:Flagellar hook protein FlgE n=1 Tax=Alkalibacillus salilacus TaxID=284582 RepID=A0ABT9VDN9_9BACI|nr:flagellar hook-basal body complex protein [Alkalibacillus salilacus]MDQ0159088.1 flagellar hook protein FlgE [Alkalibacillus salilacus]
MLRSMYTGISGMSGFQEKLDVTSNNIANVNTFGFKKGRQTFSDIMSQTTQGATAPAGDGQLGGQNPMQVGLGSNTGSIDNIHTQGNRQTTDRPLDLAIEGDGMFAVAERTWSSDDGNDVEEEIAAELGIDADDVTEDQVEKYISTEQDSIQFSRAGNFYLDEDGYVVNSNGQYLVGNTNTNLNADEGDGDDQYSEEMEDMAGRIQVPEGAQSFDIAADGTVSFVNENGQARTAGRAMLANFSNAEGLEKAGNNNFNLSDNAGLMEDGEIDFLNAPGEGGTGNLYAGALEMSNVDLSEEFTEMITAQRGFQANTRVITTSDEILQELVNLKR